jgi:UDP-N-acetylmuramoyl-L-alanyl-D-glutamate--2,6-diaminopimelate ligase
VTRAPRETAPVRTAIIVAALKRAGLLVSAGAMPETVTTIADDSRQAAQGSLFVAMRGAGADGHSYLAPAANNGATCAIVEDASAAAAAGLAAIVVRDGRRAAATAAAAFYGEPARALALVGVTGTNGKTTTVGMLRHLLDARDAPSASIGTLGVLTGSAGEPVDGGSGLTTPGPVELQRLLRTLVDRGVSSVAIEASSHALHQHRLDGLAFSAAVFTNLTRDHLDYHLTMDAYLEAKALLIGLLAPGGTAVLNADDAAWRKLPAPPKRLTFGLDSAADVRAAHVRFESRGSTWRLLTPAGEADVHLPLIGDFNIANALGAAGAALALGIPAARIADRLGSLPQVPGRLEIVGEHPTVLRDYAHTPDALERALAALRPFTPGELIVVFGAGGDRDRGKRPLMAEVADRLANRLIVTSDNPRTENPERILDDIVANLPDGRYERIEDRREAIARAIAIADPERDVVLLAGKGHENYQIRGTVKHHFDEREIVGEILSARAGLPR